ncbi:MAG: kynureninase [Bacteroidetes bacterium]|nr:kynureninase [Bacteroidota bacterium]
MLLFENSQVFARQLDEKDPLKHFRDRFHHPEWKGKPAVYLCGNSLGLQPKSAADYVRTELEDWARLGVEGHVHSRNPWLYYHHTVEHQTAALVGASSPGEVVVMNALSVNLNLMMVSFYRPTPSRYKILLEAKAFPSDQYAAEMQARFHGYDPEQAVLELPLRPGEQTHRTEDILAFIQEHGQELALILIGGVNYYSGQFFDLPALAAAGRAAGAVVGYDLAHAVGNVPLRLHDWEVDFAVWCSYKYLNSGPGGVSGVFVHHKHANRSDLPRFAGWWGNSEETRFLMEPGFHPQPGAAGWQMSNAPVLPMAVHRASLDLFAEAGMEPLRTKSEQLTGYLEYLLNQIQSSDFRIITPSDPAQRGCQLSIQFKQHGKEVFEALKQAGIIADWREPDVIRVAPVPLYNRYEDVYHFARVLQEVLEQASAELPSKK